MNLPSNLFNNYTPPQVFLCQADKTIIGELQPYDFSADFKFNTYSEISLTVDKTYINIIEGKIIKINWEKESREKQTKYTYEDGTELIVNDGNTFIQIIPKNGNISWE